MRVPLYRWFMYGSRISDGLFPMIDDVHNVKCKIRALPTDQRRPKAVTLPTYELGASLPHADNDILTVLSGLNKRINYKMPEPDKKLLRKLKIFVYKWLEKHIVPLNPTQLMTFEEWISTRSYPESRKQELRNVYDSLMMQPVHKRMHIVNCFVKDEFYTEFKHPRGIYSREDVFKVIFGPICASIENVLFKTKWFIKRVPLPDRPEVLEDLFGQFLEVMVGDFTSFEQSFKKKVMQSLDFPLFKHMLKLFCQNSNIHKTYPILSEINVMIFRGLVLFIEAIRQSGEMNTSLSNGFGNLMIGKFNYRRIGVREDEMEMIVEGDDSICGSSKNIFPTADMYAQLGFKIKINVVDHVGKTGFCGLYYHKDDKKVMADPRKQILKFGWAKERYTSAKNSTLHALTRVKGFSVAYQFDGCPILSSMGHYAIRATNGIYIDKLLNSNYFDYYERELAVTAVNAKVKRTPVGIGSRFMFEEMYGITVAQQLQCEQIFDSMNSLQPFNLPIDYSPDQLLNTLLYVHKRPVGTDPCAYMNFGTKEIHDFFNFVSASEKEEQMTVKS